MKKVIVVGVIALFICVGIQPAFAVETESSADNIENEEDCDCEEVDKVNLIRAKILLNKLEVFTNNILSRFGHIPEVEEKCKELLDIINSNKQLDYPIFCALLEDIVIKIYSTIDWLFKKSDEVGLLLGLFLLLFVYPLVFTVIPLHFLGEFMCGFPPLILINHMK